MGSLNSPLEQLAEEASRLSKFATATSQNWREQLVQRGIVPTWMGLCGSLRTGLYVGRKSSRYSTAPQPPATPFMLEADVRMVLPREMDPFDRRLLSPIEEVTGAQFTRSKTIIRWELPLQQSYLIRHDAYGVNTTLEWEITINREPYFETSPYWSTVFTADEIEEQRRLRGEAVARDVPVGLYEKLKTDQAQEFRWRLCYALAYLLHSRLPESLRELADRTRTNDILAHLVKHAADGKLTRPDVAVTLDAIATYGVQATDTPLSQPRWLAEVEASVSSDHRSLRGVSVELEPAEVLGDRPGRAEHPPSTI